MYSYKCNECGSENIELVICDQGGDSRYGKTFDESWCLDCGELNSFEKEDLIENRGSNIPENSKKHLIPPLKKRSGEGISERQKRMLERIRDGYEETYKGTSSDQSTIFSRKGQDNSYSEAMRKSRAALALSDTKGIFRPEKICPPFLHPQTNTSVHGERIHLLHDLDSIVARIYLSSTSPPRTPDQTRPRRRSGDTWASSEREWLGWELYSHMTKVMELPWFWSHWSDYMGIGDKAFIGPFSRVASEKSEISINHENSLYGLCKLLKDFEIIEVPRESMTPALRMLRDLEGPLHDCLTPCLSSNREGDVQIHRGRYVGIDEQGNEEWIEEGHSQYTMSHIPVSFALVQSLFDSRKYSLAMEIFRLLRNEIESFTSMSWSEAHAIWSELVEKNLRNSSPFPEEW